MAAPALAASMADCAICSGVTGTAGLRPGVSADPVTAHEILTLRCMPPPCPRRCLAKAYSQDRPEAQRFRPQRGDAGGEIGGGRRDTHDRARAVSHRAPRRLQLTPIATSELRPACQPAFEGLRLASHCALR